MFTLPRLHRWGFKITNKAPTMIPFWQSHTPAQVALETTLDIVWCIGFIVGWVIALWQHFAIPAASIGPIVEEIKTICQPVVKTRKRSAKTLSDAELMATF